MNVKSPAQSRLAPTKAVSTRRPPRLRKPKVKAKSTDTTQTVRVNQNVITIRGTASGKPNRITMKPSSVVVNLGPKQPEDVLCFLRPGQSPESTADQISRGLPFGFSGDVTVSRTGEIARVIISRVKLTRAQLEAAGVKPVFWVQDAEDL